MCFGPMSPVRTEGPEDMWAEEEASLAHSSPVAKAFRSPHTGIIGSPKAPPVLGSHPTHTLVVGSVWPRSPRATESYCACLLAWKGLTGPKGTSSLHFS